MATEVYTGRSAMVSTALDAYFEAVWARREAQTEEERQAAQRRVEATQEALRIVVESV